MLENIRRKLGMFGGFPGLGGFGGGAPRLPSPPRYPGGTKIPTKSGTAKVITNKTYAMSGAIGSVAVAVTLAAAGTANANFTFNKEAHIVKAKMVVTAGAAYAGIPVEGGFTVNVATSLNSISDDDLDIDAGNTIVVPVTTTAAATVVLVLYYE
jgi:LysM repeat protein